MCFESDTKIGACDGDDRVSEVGPRRTPGFGRCFLSHSGRTTRNKRSAGFLNTLTSFREPLGGDSMFFLVLVVVPTGAEAWRRSRSWR